MNEFALIERYFKRAPRNADVRIGIGDDGAVIAPVPGLEYVMTVDMLVEGRHFRAGADPRGVGHKTLAVNLSDLAAMGALPRFVLLAGALPESDPDWVAAFMEGFDALAREYDVELIGGDTTRGPRALCVTAIGELPGGTAITRSGASPGDIVYVSGRLGDAALTLAARDGRVDIEPSSLATFERRLDEPQPRVALGVALRGVASAALDISDGLTGDLSHVLAASRVGASLDLRALPMSDELRHMLEGGERELALGCVLAGGDDYELCFTASPAMRERVESVALALALPLTPIGAITVDPVLTIHDEDGRALSALPPAYDHFG